MDHMIKEKFIVTDGEKVTDEIYRVTGLDIEIDQIIENISSEESNIYFFDKDLSEKPENEKDVILAWIDTGIKVNGNEPLMISLLKRSDYFSGYYVGTPSYLVNGMCRKTLYSEKKLRSNLLKFCHRYREEHAERICKVETEVKDRSEGYCEKTIFIKNEEVLSNVTEDTSTINTYTKGIGAHEPSSIVYDVTGYKMFSADIGVENHQIASDGGVFANVKAKFKVSTSTDGSNYTQQYYAEDLSANGGLRSIRVKLPEGTTHMKLECPASAWNNGNGGKLHTCWANAKLYETVEIAVTGITLDQDALALKVGGTEEQKTATLQAAITPEDATDQEVLWESDNEEVATVDGGVVTAHKAGNATIKVSSVNYPNITAQCIVTVTRDDTALEEAIAAAESRMKEENFAEKYTEATRKALEDDLADAKAAKDNTALSVEEVKLIVESLKTSIEGLQLKAVVTINNNGNTETKYCEVGDQVRVVAAQAPEGKKFSHWTVNEKPICYNESYTFTVYKDIAVTSVYVEEAEEIQKEVSVLCDVSYANGRVKFLSKYSVPTDADYKVIKAGVVATDSTGYAAIQEVQQELTLDTTATTRLKKYGVNTDLYLANFTQYLKTSRTTTWYARGYVTYQDNSGEQHTVYSDMAQYTIR